VTQLSPHWGNVLRVFDLLLDTLKRNNVPPFLVKKLFQQLFSFVNVQLFNQLLLRRECCSFSNGEYVKTGLAEVENWIHGAGKEWVGESWDELRYIRQVRARPSPFPSFLPCNCCSGSMRRLCRPACNSMCTIML
jgi:myosin V